MFPKRILLLVGVLVLGPLLMVGWGYQMKRSTMSNNYAPTRPSGGSFVLKGGALGQSSIAVTHVAATGVYQNDQGFFEREMVPLTVASSGRGNPAPPEGVSFYGRGAMVNATVDSLVIVDPGTRYRCTGYTGTGSVPASGTAAHVDFVITGTSSLTWSWVLEYRFTVNNPTAHDTPRPTAGDHWYASGTVINGAVDSVVSDAYCIGYTGTGPLVSAAHDSFSVTLTAPGSVTWLWNAGNLVTFAAVTANPGSGSLSGSNYVALTIHYSGSDTTYQLWDAQTLVRVLSPFTTYDYAIVSSGSNANERWQTNETTSGSVTVPTTITLHYYHQYHCDLSVQTEVPYGTPLSAGNYAASQHVSFGVASGNNLWDGNGATPWVDASTNVTFPAVSSGSTANERWYTADVAVNILVGAPSTLSRTYIQQLTLVIANPAGADYPAGLDNPIPPEGTTWNHYGATVTGSVTPVVVVGPDTYYSAGYTGTGSALPDAAEPSFSFVITTPSSVTWRWWGTSHPSICNLTVTSLYDSPHPFGTVYYPCGSVVTATVDSTVVVGGTTYICLGWSGTGSVPAMGWDNNVTFTLSGTSTLTWRWAPNNPDSLRSLTVVSPHDTPVPPVGITWWYTGSTVNASVDSTTTDGIHTWIVHGFRGTGSAPDSGYGDHVTFPINANSTLGWEWVRSDSAVTLTVASAYGSPDPPVGTTVWRIGSMVYARVESTMVVGGITYVCAGWNGTGSVPANGWDNNASFAINGNSTITWLWAPMGSITPLYVASTYGSPAPPRGRSVYAHGATVTATVDTTVVAGGFTYVCSGWLGSGSAPAIGWDNDLSFTINDSSNITWQWIRSDSVLTLTVSSLYDTPFPPVGVSIWRIGAVVNATVDSLVTVGGIPYVCVGWTGSGSVPAFGGDNNVTFTMTANSTLDWRWVPLADAVPLIVTSPHGNPIPTVGRTIWSRGNTVSASVESTLVVGSDTYVCIGWIGTGSATPRGWDNNFTFTITDSSTITWLWALEQDVRTLTVASTYGTPLPPVGVTLWATGNTVDAINDSIVIIGPNTWVCGGWVGTGSTPRRGSDNNVSFVITENSTLTWRWINQSDLVTLTVHADTRFDCDPPNGVSFYSRGEHVDVTTNDFVDLGIGIRIYVTGWTTDFGDAPPEGDLTSFDFTINNPTSVTWHYLRKFQISLTHTGTGALDPTQSGEGWYFEDSLAVITTDPWIGAFGFIGWTSSPSGANFDPSSYYTDLTVVVDTSYILTASYGPAVPYLLLKSPLGDNMGGFRVDGRTYSSVAFVNAMFALGSYHAITASNPDSSGTPGAQYNFRSWHDDFGDTLNPTNRMVGPITRTDTSIAVYNYRFRCTIALSPGTLRGNIIVDGTSYPDTNNLLIYLNETGTHTLNAPQTVPQGDTIRWTFANWSTGATTPTITVSVTGPVTYTATYSKRYRVIVQKDPIADTYGWLKIGTTTYLGASETVWVAESQTLYIEGSPEEMTTDASTVYIWDSWSDALDIGHTTAPINGPAVFTAHYLSQPAVVDFLLNPDVWDLSIPESLRFESTRTMADSEKIVVTNNGNMRLNFGLQIIDEPGFFWLPAFYAAIESYSLHAKFYSDGTIPLESAFGRNDMVSRLSRHDTPSWFGPAGFNVLPPNAHIPGRDISDVLWFRLDLPTYSIAVYQVIRVRVTAIPQLW